MRHIMLVSENRKLLKQVYDFLEESEQYQVHTINSSTNAFESFVELKPAIIILDTDTVMPYKTILQQIKQCRWDYRVILLDDSEVCHTVVEQDGKYLSKNHINRDKLRHTIQMAFEEMMQGKTKQQKTDTFLAKADNIRMKLFGHIEFIAPPDFYHILYAKYLGNESFEVTRTQQEQIKNSFIPVGEVDIVCENNHDIILVMRKSQMRKNFVFSRSAEIVTRYLGPHFAFFLCENINWKKLNDTYLEIVDLSKYSYFYYNQSVYLQRIRKNIREIDINTVNQTLFEVVNFIFAGNKYETKKRLKELYFYVLKPSLDFDCVYYLRRMVNLINLLFASILGIGMEEIRLEYPFIEAEFEQVERLFSEFCQGIERKTINPLVVKAVLYTLNNYKLNISLDSAASKMDVTKIYLSRIFKEEIGMTFLEFLQIIRMNIATELLKCRKLKIKDISEAVGYRDPHYFSRVYKKRTGISPKHYRNKFIKKCNQTVKG